MLSSVSVEKMLKVGWPDRDFIVCKKVLHNEVVGFSGPSSSIEQLGGSCDNNVVMYWCSRAKKRKKKKKRVMRVTLSYQ